MDKYVLWAGIVGAFSAISLLIGSVIGVSFKLPKTCIGLFAAFGAGALLSALAIELIAPTITAFTSATNEIDRLRESHHFLVLVSGCAFGGVIFVLLDQLVNAKGGYLRKTAYILSKVAIERKSFHQKALNELIKSRVFVNLPYEKISLVIDHFRPRFFNAGESIFVQGDKSHGIYMIRKGIVEIYQQDHPQPIQLGHGEIIGEISFIAGRPYSADCVAKTNVELMLLTTHEFESIQKQVPEFEQRLKDLAAERLDEMQDPELSIDRGLEQYLKLGYSENWINQRLKSIEIRKELTDEWKKRGLKEGLQFATLTEIISKAWSDKTTKEYKVLKGLKKENLRDNMTNTELILNMLAEASTKEISAATNPKDFEENKKVAKQGGNVAKVARLELEDKTGKKVVTSLNAKDALKALPEENNKPKKNKGK